MEIYKSDLVAKWIITLQQLQGQLKLGTKPNSKGYGGVFKGDSTSLLTLTERKKQNSRVRLNMRDKARIELAIKVLTAKIKKVYPTF